MKALTKMSRTNSGQQLERGEQMQTVIRIGLLGLLVVTWLAVFYTVSLFTELILAPWDTALVRPEIGTWQRTLNDFFENGGALVVSVPVVLASITLALPMLRQNSLVLFNLMVGNLAFCTALWVAFLAAAFINNQVLFPYPPVTYDPTYEGFHRSVLPMAAQLVVCAAWLLWLRRVGKHGTPASASLKAAAA